MDGSHAGGVCTAKLFTIFARLLEEINRWLQLPFMNCDVSYAIQRYTQIAFRDEIVWPLLVEFFGDSEIGFIVSNSFLKLTVLNGDVAEPRSCDAQAALDVGNVGIS